MLARCLSISVLSFIWCRIILFQIQHVLSSCVISAAGSFLDLWGCKLVPSPPFPTADFLFRDGGVRRTELNWKFRAGNKAFARGKRGSPAACFRSYCPVCQIQIRLIGVGIKGCEWTVSQAERGQNNKHRLLDSKQLMTFYSQMILWWQDFNCTWSATCLRLWGQVVKCDQTALPSAVAALYRGQGAVWKSGPQLGTYYLSSYPYGSHL
jgi:hypothetical protein